MARQKMADLSLDPFVLAMDHADDLKPIPEKFASAWLSVSVTVMEDWRRTGRSTPPPPPRPFRLTTREVLYAMGDLRQFVRNVIEVAQATERPPAPPEPTLPTPAAEALAKITGTPDLSTLGMDQDLMRGGRRKRVNQATFAQFLRDGRAEDEWVIAMIPDPHLAPVHRPVDLIETLTLELTDEQIAHATCEQINKMDYLRRSLAYLAAQAGQDDAAERLSTTEEFEGKETRDRPIKRS